MWNLLFLIHEMYYYLTLNDTIKNLKFNIVKLKFFWILFFFLKRLEKKDHLKYTRTLEFKFSNVEHFLKL